MVSGTRALPKSIVIEVEGGIGIGIGIEIWAFGLGFRPWGRDLDLGTGIWT